MEISDLELFEVQIGRGDGEAPARSTLICVSTNSGRQGWGEAPLIWHLDQLPQRRQALLAALSGRSVFSAGDLAESNVLDSAPLCCAVEMAMWDIVGQVAGQPLCNLWGGAYRARIPLAVKLLGDASLRNQHLAREMIEHGFHSLVFSAGDEADETAAALDLLRDLVGQGCDIVLDGGTMFSPDAALRICAALPEGVLTCFIDPVRDANLTAISSIAGLTTVPLGLDRSIRGPRDAMTAIRNGGVRWLVVQPHRVGGLLASQRTSHVTCAGGLTAALDMTGSVGVAMAAMLQLAAALPGLDHNQHTDYPRLADDVLSRPLVIVDGMAALPRGPGLGIEVDRDKVDRYLVS